MRCSNSGRNASVPADDTPTIKTGFFEVRFISASPRLIERIFTHFVGPECGIIRRR